METNKRVIVGVSGGPDSMYLLNKLKVSGFKPIVCHINYKFRKEADEEFIMVKNYCQQEGIEFNGFEVEPNDWNKYKHLKNKQSMARELRYDLYIYLAKEFNTRDIYIAHHKDDFLETAIMQKNRSNDYLFFGIEPLSIYKGYNINRPLLNIYKEDIIKDNVKNNIPFRIDKSNEEPIYDRNKIRLELKDKSSEYKDELIKEFNSINSSKKAIKENTMKEYHSWRRENFSYERYINIPDELKRYVIYRLLIQYRDRINISSDKLDGIVDFLKTKKGDKSYRLMENTFLRVSKGIINVYTK